MTTPNLVELLADIVEVTMEAMNDDTRTPNAWEALNYGKICGIACRDQRVVDLLVERGKRNG